MNKISKGEIPWRLLNFFVTDAIAKISGGGNCSIITGYMRESSKAVQTNFYPVLVLIGLIHSYMVQYGFVYNYELNKIMDICTLRVSDSSYFQSKVGQISFTSSSVSISDSYGWGFYYVILGY